MAKQNLAIALCRVSTAEQLENNSLNRQRDAVLRAASELGVSIPESCWWSGSVSSKRGTNVNRRDLQEMIDYCKKDKRVKYAIVDEPDRFMRSIDEAAYFEVTFRQLGVTVWYASDPELNKGDLASKLLKFTKYLSAEGSNEERQRKSISGQTKALMDGRYPFSPKPGYRRGYERGIQEPHETRGPALKNVLVRLASNFVTPSEALVELNKSEFMKDGHSPYKMDKFRKIVTDPFYAGIVEIHQQVDIRNENGLHEPLITREQHLEILRIMNGKPKNQSGPRKNGNPKYPLSNLVACDKCLDKRVGRLVGLDLSNGKSSKIYERYRCRSCMRYSTRDEIHDQIEQLFKKYSADIEESEQLIQALNVVWRQKETQVEQDARNLEAKISNLQKNIATQVEAATEPSNAAIRDDILALIVRKKEMVAALEDELDNLRKKADSDKDQFLRFAFDFIRNMGSNFLMLSPENRLRCKELVFPGGFYVNENKKVYTPEISPLITLATKKKDAEASDNSHLVRVRRL